MARNDSLVDQIQSQNGRKSFVQKIAFTTASAITVLNITDVNGVRIPSGASLMLQADADFLYELKGATGTTVVTVQSGARAGVFVPLNAQEFVILHGSSAGNSTWGQDTRIDVIGNTAGGNLNVFVVA